VSDLERRSNTLVERGEKALAPPPPPDPWEHSRNHLIIEVVPYGLTEAEYAALVIASHLDPAPVDPLGLHIHCRFEPWRDEPELDAPEPPPRPVPRREPEPAAPVPPYTPGTGAEHVAPRCW